VTLVEDRARPVAVLVLDQRDDRAFADFPAQVERPVHPADHRAIDADVAAFGRRLDDGPDARPDAGRGGIELGIAAGDGHDAEVGHLEDLVSIQVDGREQSLDRIGENVGLDAPDVEAVHLDDPPRALGLCAEVAHRPRCAEELLEVRDAALAQSVLHARIGGRRGDGGEDLRQRHERLRARDLRVGEDLGAAEVHHRFKSGGVAPQHGLRAPRQGISGLPRQDVDLGRLLEGDRCDQRLVVHVPCLAQDRSGRRDLGGLECIERVLRRRQGGYRQEGKQDRGQGAATRGRFHGEPPPRRSLPYPCNGWNGVCR
jgi:hypothetical protein